MKNANKKYWLIMHLEARSNKYLKFLLDSTGIHLDHSQVIGDSIRGHHAQSQFSPDGKKIVTASADSTVKISVSYTHLTLPTSDLV